MWQFLRRASYVSLAIAWAAVTAFGIGGLWSYGSTPGGAGSPALAWPPDARVNRASGGPTLVMAVHPRCPCSRATLGELARLMADCRGKLAATVLFVRPAGIAAGWERTGLWREAVAIPGVTAVVDEGGVQSRRFGALTSGHAVLYSTAGQLQFVGGITEARGHSGDNAGRSAITSLVLEPRPADVRRRPRTAVYGCPLTDRSEACGIEGTATCHK